MARYVAIATKATWADDAPFVRAYEVESVDRVDTGLVDAFGTTLYRLSNPIGFTAKIEE
jgi:hypothetical protein